MLAADVLHVHQVSVCTCQSKRSILAPLLQLPVKLQYFTPLTSRTSRACRLRDGSPARRSTAMSCTAASCASAPASASAASSLFCCRGQSRCWCRMPLTRPLKAVKWSTCLPQGSHVLYSCQLCVCTRQRKCSVLARLRKLLGIKQKHQIVHMMNLGAPACRRAATTCTAASYVFAAATDYDAFSHFPCKLLQGLGC